MTPDELSAEDRDALGRIDGDMRATIDAGRPVSLPSGLTLEAKIADELVAELAAEAAFSYAIRHHSGEVDSMRLRHLGG